MVNTSEKSEVWQERNVCNIEVDIADSITRYGIGDSSELESVVRRTIEKCIEAGIRRRDPREGLCGLVYSYCTTCIILSWCGSCTLNP